MNIEFFYPKTKTPPFNQRLLVALGSNITNNAGKDWESIFTFHTVTISTESPNDEEYNEQYNEYIESNDEYLDYQFILKDVADCEEEMSWYSDSITAWAYHPKIIEVTR